ncbi:unnamed protein product [Malus baccata var. baccata]
MEQGTQGSIVLRRHGKGESQEDEERVVDLSGQVHLLPCSIKFNGPSNVSQYFKPKPTGIESEGLRTQEACFRGRKLQGASISVPDGYSDAQTHNSRRFGFCISCFGKDELITLSPRVLCTKKKAKNLTVLVTLSW